MGLEIVWRRKMRICEQILDRGGRALVGIVIALSASGCIAIYGTAEFVSIKANKKVLVDNFASTIAGKDCQFSNIQNGRSYCIDEIPAKPLPVYKPLPSYCYATLADVTCYTEPKPYRRLDG